MKLTVSLEECKNPSIPLSPPHQFHSEFVTREIGFADKRSKLKAVDGTRKLHFIRSKQTSLTIPAAQGEGGLEGGGRGKEGAKPHRTQSATDRKIKEHDAVGSRARAASFCVMRKGERRTDSAGKRKVSEVTRASRVSSFAGIAKFSARENSSETICSDYARRKYISKRGHVFLYRRVPYGITLLLLLRIKGWVDDRLTSYLLTFRRGRRERNDL